MLIDILKRSIAITALSVIFLQQGVYSSDNQTQDLSPILPGSSLPFEIEIEEAGFRLPQGFHSGASANYQGLYVFIAGRTNGMHTFDPGDNNFPPSKQNRTVFVVDFLYKTVVTRELDDPLSGLSSHQIDQLSVTSPQSYQKGDTLYITGGYGVNSETGEFSTKESLTAIKISGLVNWVLRKLPGDVLSNYIRQIANPIFRVTGGYMAEVERGTTLLVFGQNFQGFYNTNSNGIYTEQVRRFRIIDDGINLGVEVLSSKPKNPNPNYRRRDLNVTPSIAKKNGKYVPSLVAFSGVFTDIGFGGVWTVPVTIASDGTTHMDDPAAPKTFKQGMNNYACATVGIFDANTEDMYTVFLGGISYGFFQNGTFQTDDEIPFINQVTTVKLNKKGVFKQYLMDVEYPFVPVPRDPSTSFYFGSATKFVIDSDILRFENGVFDLRNVKGKQTLGYVIGGIQSKVDNTQNRTDSGASPHIFRVFIKSKIIGNVSGSHSDSGSSHSH